MNPETNNEAAADAPALNINEKPPVIEGITEPTPEEIAAKQAAEARQAQEEAKARFLARKEASLQKDSMEFLTRTQATDLGYGFYRVGSRILATDSSFPMRSLFVQRLAIIHIAGQKGLQHLANVSNLKLEELQSAFNGVPIADEERQVLVLNTAVAAVEAAYESVESYIDDIFPTVGAAFVNSLAQMRIPPEKDGGKFVTLEALYAPLGGRFQLDLLIGVIIKYEGENNHYAMSFTDFSADPNSDEAMDVRAFTDEVLGQRNRYIDQYVVATLPDYVAKIVAKVGTGILKVDEPAQPELPTEAANDPAPTNDNEQPA